MTFALRQAESGSAVPEVCRKMGISELTFYRWKKKYIGMGIAELSKGREKVEAWRQEYNNERTHGAMGNISPLAYAAAMEKGV